MRAWGGDSGPQAGGGSVNGECRTGNLSDSYSQRLKGLAKINTVKCRGKEEDKHTGKLKVWVTHAGG